MACKHERLRTVGDRVFCSNCGEELPLEALTGVKTPKKAENPANNPPEGEKTGKSTRKKTQAKKPE